MHIILRSALFGLGLQFLAGTPVLAAGDELTAFLPETLAGMTRMDMFTDNAGTRKVVALYDVNGDGAEDVELTLVDLEGYADAVRLFFEANIAEGRNTSIDIAGLTGAVTSNEITPYLVSVVSGRVWAAAAPWWKADGVAEETVQQALSNLDFAAMVSFGAPGLETGGRPDLRIVSLPLEPGFLLPGEISGLAQNTGLGYRPKFSQFGGPLVEGLRYDNGTEGGPAVIGSVWDFGGFGDEAQRRLAVKAEAEGWKPIAERGYPGYLAEGAEPRAYLSVGRLRLRLDAENGGADAAGLQAALASIDLDRLHRFAALTPSPAVLDDPETTDLSPVDPEALANALPEAVAGFARTKHKATVEAQTFRELRRETVLVQALYAGKEGQRFMVRAADSGLALFADAAWLDASGLGLTEAQRGDQTLRVFRERGETGALLDVEGRIGVMLAPGKGAPEGLLFDLASEFDMSRIAALLAGDAPATGTVQASCPGQDCFEAAFAACAPASYLTGEALGARARYEILGPAEGGCRVSLVFEANPNSQWVGKSLEMILSSAGPFIEAFQAGLQACISNAAVTSCDGPLLSVMRGN